MASSRLNVIVTLLVLLRGEYSAFFGLFEDTAEISGLQLCILGWYMTLLSPYIL